jgi:hypothetical protein
MRVVLGLRSCVEALQTAKRSSQRFTPMLVVIGRSERQADPRLLWVRGVVDALCETMSMPVSMPVAMPMSSQPRVSLRKLSSRSA